MRRVAAANGEPPMNVLVAHDARHIARLMQVNLERQGYAVNCAFDGKEAVDFLRAAESATSAGYEMAVLGTTLRRIDAYEVLMWIRTGEKTEFMRVVMILSPDDDKEEWQQREFRADLYLQAPFNPKNLWQ